MNVVWQKKKQVGKTRSSLSNYLSLLSVWYRSNKPADFGVTRSTPSCYVSQQYHFTSIWSMWPDHHYYVIFHNSIWGKHRSKWRTEFGVTINHHCFVICKNSMVCQTLEQVTALSWRDQITTIVIVLKNYKTKTVADNQLSLMWSDHHYQIICYKNWSKRLAKNCATRSSLSRYLSWPCCEKNKGARDKLGLVWPDDMHDNSITLQTIQVTYSGLCDLIITIMLTFSRVFCDKYRNKWPADLVRS